MVEPKPVPPTPTFSQPYARPTVVEDVACTRCGCVCDDLRVTISGQRIVDVENACDLSENWFLEQNARSPAIASISGKEVALADAVSQAAELLREAKAPLVYGLSRSSTEGQRAAVRLADILGANVDTTASLCHAPSIMAIQEVGESTCSLGEIKNRADLVVFWGVDPATTHPRHLERYSGDATGMFIKDGRSNRHVVVVDSKRTATVDSADEFLRIEPGRDFEMIWALRSLLAGFGLPEGYDAGVSRSSLDALLERLRSCRCGVFFFGLGLASGATGHRAVEALLRLTCDLNAHTRFHARRMRIYGDVAGADTVLCWQTGFPFSVNLARGYPRYSPDEYSANALLERGEVDACLLIGAESLPEMSDSARRLLKQIPTILLDHVNAEVQIQPTIQIHTAVYGVHFPGTAYRMDEIPIPLRGFLPTCYPADADVLNRIQDALMFDTQDPMK